jgi:hypothetical protein
VPILLVQLRFYWFTTGIMCKFAEGTLPSYFSETYYSFSTCTLCYWRGPAPMTRTLLVYNWFHTCSTTSTTCLGYNPSRDRFRLDGFIDCSYTSGYLLYAWARGLVPPFCNDYFMTIIWLLAREFDVTRHSARLQGQLSCLHAGCCTIPRQCLIQEAF